MDEIEMYEVEALLRNSYYKEREDWEQARLIAYVIAQCNSTKKMKVSDIMEFPWDKEQTEKVMPQAQVDRLREKAERMRKMMNEIIEKD